MAKMDETMTCEVVQDLLPLYTDGACTQGSKQLVEEHVKGCERCRKQLGEMGAPIEGLLAEPEPELSETEILLANALKKMRANSKRVVAVCLAILIAIPLFVLCSRELTGQGLCLSNLEEYQNVKNTVTAWVEKGSAAAVDSMSPLWLYEDVSQIRSDHEIFSTFNKTTAYDGDCSQGKYTCLELLGENFYFPGEVFLDDGTNYRRHLKELYDAGAEMEFIYSMMQNGEILVPFDIFHIVMSNHDEMDPEEWDFIELDGQQYYFYKDWWYEFEDVYARKEALVDYDPEIYELMPDIERPSFEYFVLLHCYALPEEPQRYFEQCYEEIYNNYQSYNQYYEFWGYEGFRDQWRAQLKALLQELESLGWTVTDGDFRAIAYNSAEDYQCVSWRLNMGGHWVYIDFDARDRGEGVMGCVRYPVQIYCYNAPEEVQAIFDQINELCSAEKRT